MGFNPEAARYSGMSVGKNYILVMAVCGLFAGLAGSIDVLGWQFRIATNDIQIADLGFIGIAVALLGRNTAVGTVAAALLFGALLSGTSQRNLDPTIFEPSLAVEPHLDHPGPRHPDRERRRARARAHRPWARHLPRGRAAPPAAAEAEPVSTSVAAGRQLAISARTAAWAGIVLGVLAAYVALPPLHDPNTRWCRCCSPPRAWPPASTRRARASGGSAGSRCAWRSWEPSCAVMAVKSGESQPRAGLRLVSAHGRHAALRDAPDLRRDGRHHVRAQRRHQHRPRGHDADRARSSGSSAPTCSARGSSGSWSASRQAR